MSPSGWVSVGAFFEEVRVDADLNTLATSLHGTIDDLMFVHS
ncbi:hypothetical protein ACFVVC_04315 [Pseudarthrobacter sp. NPDC058196]